MIDTINLELTQAEVNGVDFLSVVTPNLGAERLIWHDNGAYQYATCKLGNLSICVRSDVLRVGGGSLCKWYLGDNYQAMTREDVRQAVDRLSNILQVPMERANITRLDFGAVLVMDEPITNYFLHFGEYKPVGSRAHFERLMQTHALYYRAARKAEEVCFYDKNQAQRNQREQIPEHYRGCNVLRLEHRLLKQIPKRLKVPRATASLLYKEQFYQGMRADLVTCYQNIDKTNEQLLNTTDMKGVKELYKKGVIALAEKCGGQVALIKQIDAAQKRGAIDRKQAQRQRDAVREALKWDKGLTEPSAALAELNGKILALLNDDG